MVNYFHFKCKNKGFEKTTKKKKKILCFIREENDNI